MAIETVRIADKETVDKIYNAVTSTSSSQTPFVTQLYYTDLNMFGKDGPAYNDDEVMTTLFNDVRSCNNEVITRYLYDYGVDNNLHMGQYFKRFEGLENVTELDDMPTMTEITANADICNKILATELGPMFNDDLKLYTVTDKKFSTMSYADMQTLINAHYAGKINISDYWNVGDTRSVSFGAMSTVTGIDETHSAHSQLITIIGFNHDTLTAGGTGAVSLQLKNTLPVTGKMNTTNTNTTGWTSCPRRTWCNSIFYNALPTDLKGMVKQVNKRTSAGNMSTTIDTTSDYCFLLSECEIVGVRTHSVDGEGGTQYDYYKTESNRIKYQGDTTTLSVWWDRSPYHDGKNYFCLVNASGTANYGNANSSFGFAPAFVI